MNTATVRRFNLLLSPSAQPLVNGIFTNHTGRPPDGVRFSVDRIDKKLLFLVF